MTQSDSGYDLTPTPPEPEKPAAPKPGEPGWVPPVPVIEKAEEDTSPPSDPDIEQHKGAAILAYICFLIPLIAAPNSRFARYHANQGLIAFIILIAAVVMVAVLHAAELGLAYFMANMMNIAVLNYFFSCGLTLLQLGLLVGWVALVIAGIVNAANGLTKPLPVLGHLSMIK